MKQAVRLPDLRRQNTLIVLRHFFSNLQASQSELVKKTGLKPATISRIFSQLEEDGLISEDQQNEVPQETGKSVLGRRPVQYKLVPAARFAAGIDLTPRYFVMVITDFSRNIIYKNRVELPDDLNASILVHEVSSEYLRARDACSLPPEKLLGLGIGIPGRVDTENGNSLNYPRIQGLHQYPLAEKISSLISAPVFIHNNCSVITMGAYHYDAGVQVSGSLLMVLLRYGVGAGFYADGHDYEAGQKTKLEIGHMPMDLNGPVCSCGARGCLEAYLGEDALIHDLQRYIKVESIQDITGSSLENSGAAELLEERGKLLYRAVKSLYQVLYPDNFLIISRNEVITDTYTRIIRKEFAEDSVDPAPHVFGTTYDPYVYSQGACDLVWNNLMNGRYEDELM